MKRKKSKQPANSAKEAKKGCSDRRGEGAHHVEKIESESTSVIQPPPPRPAATSSCAFVLKLFFLILCVTLALGVVIFLSSESHAHLSDNDPISLFEPQSTTETTSTNGYVSVLGDARNNKPEVLPPRMEGHNMGETKRSEDVDPDTCGEEVGSTRDTSVIDEYIEHLIKHFRGIVDDTTSLQAGSWIRHTGLHRVEDVGNTSASIDRGDISSPEGEGNKLSEVAAECSEGVVEYSDQGNSALTTMPKGSAGCAINTASEFDSFPNVNINTKGIVWDDESDVTTYFDRLFASCSADATSDLAGFQKRCWGFLKGLVSEPRCTVVMDSRTVCQTDTGRSTEATTMATDDLIRNHFTKDSVNLVILGGGPVGLALANAMVELRLRSVSEEWPQTRILVFENRLHNGISNGRKEPYARDWVTDIPGKNLYGAIDPRISKFLIKIHEKGANIALPINMLETLLLLSNRDSPGGMVKFIYDDYRLHEEALGAAPNLLVFDATGHRLEGQIIRSNARDVAKVRNYTPKPGLTTSLLREKYRVRVADIDLLAMHEKPPRVAQAQVGTRSDVVTYPVLPHTDQPYYIDYVKISFSFTPTIWTELMEIQSRTPGRSSPLCIGNTQKDKFRNWCGHDHFFYEMSRNYRADIQRTSLVVNPGFSMRTVIANLSPPQAKIIRNWIAMYGSAGNKHDAAAEELDLTQISPDAVLNAPSSIRENNLDQVLLTLIRNEARVTQKYSIRDGRSKRRGAMMSVFRYIPYMYTDPIVRGGIVFGSDQSKNQKPVPLVRIGDSLLSGDVNASSGLVVHLFLIRRLQCFLWGKEEGTDLCTSPPRRTPMRSHL